MADYRKRLVDMTDEERAEVAPGAPQFSKDYENVDDPLSVQMMEAGLDFTPVGTVKGISDIKDELSSDDPNYLKAIGMGAVEAAALIPGAAPVLKGMVKGSLGNTEKLITSKKDLGFDMGEPYDYDLTLKMEDIIDEWASGDINNPKLRKKLGELDIKLGNRIGPKADPSTLEIQMPDGRVFYGTGDVPSTPRPMAEPLEIGFNEALQDGKFLKGYDASTASDMADKAKNATAGNTRANALMNAAVPEGTRVGVRLNLNSTIPDMPKGLDKLQTLHKGSFSGTAMSYLPFATVRNVTFNVSQKGRTAIASRIKQIDTPEAKSKYPAMSVDGDYVPNKNLLDEGGDLVEIGLNPGAHHLFIDLKTGQAVKGAEEATVIGDRVYAKGVEYWKKAEAPAPLATQSGVDIPSDVRFKFKKGGAVMDEQMEMAFGDEGGRVDPVSGNEVPTGSLPEEVRDDIPAQLSEGEYVVPADVVRFFGVKFFEDIRNEAKQGFANMEANGRIGGEPVVAIGMEVVEPQDDLDIMLDDSDFEVVDGYAEGGVVGAASDILSGQAQGLMEYRQYRNPAGEEITIMFFNGMPMSLIPEGYVPVVTDTDLAAAEAAETGSVAASSVAQQQPVYTGEAQPMGGDSDDRTVADMPTPEAVNYKELTPDELRDMVKQGRELAPRTVPLIAGLLNPFAGLAIKAAMWHQSVQVENELKRRLKEPDLSEDAKTFYEDLLEIQIADKPSLADKIFKDDSEAEAILGRSYSSPAQLAAESVDAQVDAEAIDASVRAAFEGAMPTGMAPIADPESIEITSLGDEPGARDYKGPLAGLSPMLDTKGGVPEPYVYEPEAPAVTSPDSANAAAFYASEDMVIADQRRDKINELMAEKKAEREAKMAELDAQIKAQQERLEAQQRAADLAQAQASAQASLAQAASNDNDSNDTYQTAVRAARAAADTRARNQAAGLGAQTKKGSLAGSKSGYFD